MAEGCEFHLGTVILAAGFSSRMGRQKMLLPWGETTVLGQLLTLWQQLPATQIAVVCPSSNNSMESELDRLQFSSSDRIVNPDPGRGMFSSIQCASRWGGWNPALTHWALVLGDQPHLQPATLRTLVGFAKQHPGKICQPARHGHSRHPVLLPREAFRDLARSRDKTLKEFLASYVPEAVKIEVDDPGLDLDLDSPADYEKAMELFLNRP